MDGPCCYSVTPHGVGDPRVLVAVAPQVLQEPMGGGRVLIVPPGQGKHILWRWLDGHDSDPVGTHGVGGGFSHHRDGGAIPDGPPVGAERHGRGDRGFYDFGLEPAELAAHELEAFEGAGGERARVHQEGFGAEFAEGHHLPAGELGLLTGQDGQAAAPQRLGPDLVCPRSGIRFREVGPDQIEELA